MTWCRAVSLRGPDLPYTHLSRPALIRRFTATGEAAPLRAALRAYADERRQDPGCEAGVTVHTSDSPASFVHLERWSGFGELRRAAHRPALLPTAARLHRVASSVDDLAVSVGRMTAYAPLDEAGCITLISCLAEVRPAAFELAVGSLLGPCVASDGYQGSELLRSVVAPHRYTVIVWWRDRECCRRGLGGPGDRDPLRALERVGSIEDEVRAGVPARG